MAIKCRERYVIMVFLAIVSDTDKIFYYNILCITVEVIISELLCFLVQYSK